jgi:hypothetical protein
VGIGPTHYIAIRSTSSSVNLISGAIIELRRARIGVVGHRLSVFERGGILREPALIRGLPFHILFLITDFIKSKIRRNTGGLP